MKKLLITTTAVLLAACTQEPPVLCDREAIEWSKWGTVEVPPECQPSESVRPLYPSVSVDDPRDVPKVPNTPTPPSDGPENEPETPSVPDEPTRGGPKGNNGWGNGDQSAPGNSGSNNNAENDRGGRTQRNHGQANSN